MEDVSQLKGLVREIRLSTANDEFDLAGYDEQRTTDMAKKAFGTPLTFTSQPLQFTFIVGGGKLVRSRYHDELRRWLSDSLKEIGYEEDRGGSLGSQGCFKHQHDTNLNLIKVHVFPNIITNDDNTNDDENVEKSSKEDSPAYLVATCSLAVFKSMVCFYVM